MGSRESSRLINDTDDEPSADVIAVVAKDIFAVRWLVCGRLFKLAGQQLGAR